MRGPSSTSSTPDGDQVVLEAADAAELGGLLNDDADGRRTEDELTVFKSMGLAAEDLAAAQLIVARARERGLGSEVDF